MVFVIQAFLCFTIFAKNSKIQNSRHFWQEKHFLTFANSLQRYPMGKNFRLNRSISHGFQDTSIFVFYHFCEKFENSKWPSFLKIGFIISRDTLWVKNFVEITLSRSVSEINAFLRKKNSRWRQKWWENVFWKKSPVDTAESLRVKNFVEFALSRSVSEINAFLPFTQKFKMADKSGGKMIFCEKSPVDSASTLWDKNFVKITLSRSISEINAFLLFQH